MLTDLAKFRRFGKILKVIGQFFGGLYSIWQTFVPFWHFFATGQIFIDVIGQILNSNIAVWSHWFQSEKVTQRKGERRQKQYRAMVQWIRPGLPSCGPGFESQAHNLCFYIVIFVL